MKRLYLLILIIGLVVHLNGSTPSSGQSASSVPEKVVFTHSNSLDLKSVKSESTWIPEDSEAQRAAWETVLAHCTPVEAGKTISNSCYVALTEYYSDQPVWAYSELRYFDSMRGMKRVTVRYTNDRPFLLPYSRADYAIEEIPLLKDIFDGQISQRASRFGKVLQDDECENLISPQSTGITEHLADHCISREMYKYATYLDVCSTGIQKLEALSAIDDSLVSRDQDLTTYDMSVFLTENKIHDFESRTLALERLEKGYLHAYWVTEQCSMNTLVLVPNPWISTTDQAVQWRSDKYFLIAIKRTRDVALKIAAKSGDEWAIRSYPFSVRNSGEFIGDVMEKYPLLVHRHLASYTGSGLSKDLARTERRQHRAKVYLMLEDQDGSQFAQKVINISNLNEEINYVLSGGELAYPFSR